MPATSKFELVEAEAKLTEREQDVSKDPGGSELPWISEEPGGSKGDGNEPAGGETTSEEPGGSSGDELVPEVGGVPEVAGALGVVAIVPVYL